jgi:hypothetical protein
MQRSAKFSAAVTLLLLSGCYRAVVETGRAPSGQEIHREWASSWLAGLVPPSTIATATVCPSGVARVETKHSFLNQVVAGLTLGIYTPMDVRVQCALAGTALGGVEFVPARADAVEAQRAIARAATRSLATGEPVLVVREGPAMGWDPGAPGARRRPGKR